MHDALRMRHALCAPLCRRARAHAAAAAAARARACPQDKALAAAVEEQAAILGRHGVELSMDVLGEMEVLHRNITEALRIHPPLLLVMRYAKTPFSVTTSQGRTFTVPAVRPRAHATATAGGARSRQQARLHALVPAARVPPLCAGAALAPSARALARQLRQLAQLAVLTPHTSCPCCHAPDAGRHRRCVAQLQPCAAARVPQPALV